MHQYYYWFYICNVYVIILPAPNFSQGCSFKNCEGWEYFVGGVTEKKQIHMVVINVKGVKYVYVLYGAKWSCFRDGRNRKKNRA